MQPEAKVNILLVDDYLKNLLALEAILDILGHNLVRATSGKEALRCILAQNFAVILLDVQMPGMNGFETARLIRERPTSQHTPIIFITGNYQEESDLERGYSLGAVDYLLKPIVPAILLSKIAAFVSLFQKNAEVKRQSAQLKIANNKLKNEISKRKLAEKLLRNYNENLEKIIIGKRTAELAKINESLIAEISERKLAEEALRSREIQLRAIFESALDAIVIRDDDGTYLEANPAAVEMFGLPLAELLGKRMADFMEPSFDFDLSWCNFQKQGQATLEIFLLRPDGTVRRVESACKANFIPGRHLSILRDITERKQAEEIQLALEAEKELRRLQLRFFSMASHEFRTPLSTIIGSTQLLKSCAQEWPEEKRLRNLHRIERAAKNLTQLLDDILTINRAETGKLEFNPNPIELEKICIDLLEELQVTNGYKHQIIFVSKGQCSRHCGDEKLLRYILINLLSNALKYSPQVGKINFHLICEQSEIIFQIQDEGIGIPPEDKQHLFELFHRGQNVENIPGTGLGLSVVKKCLDLQGGTISVESEVGVGTTVTVTIPKKS